MGISLGRKTIGRPCSLSEEQITKCIDLYQSGISLQRIAKTIRSSYGTIQRALTKRIALRPDSQFAHKLNHAFFETIDTEAKAYWLGFLAADGNVYGTRIQINLGEKDTEHLRLFAQDIGSTAPVKKSANGCVTLAFRSKSMVSDLAKHGIGPRKSITYVPWQNADPELQRHFWRGMVDGDGWITSNPQIGLCGSSNTVTTFAEYVRTSVGPEREHRAAGSIWRVTYAGKDTVVVAQHLYHSCTRSLDRKRATYLAVMRWAQRA